MEVKIRVGLRAVKPGALGFKATKIFISPRKYHNTAIIILRRKEEEIVVAKNHEIRVIIFGDGEKAEKVEVEKDIIITLRDLVNGWHSDFDFPYYPFKKALELLEEQQEEVFSIPAAGYWVGRKSRVPAHIYDYLQDIAALIIFSLTRRGVPKCEAVKVVEGAIDGVLDEDRARVAAGLRDLKRFVALADEPAPHLANRAYVEIADRAVKLFSGIIGILML